MKAEAALLLERAVWAAVVLSLGVLLLYQRSELSSIPMEVWMQRLGLAALSVSGKPSAWNSSVVIVPAVYREWDDGRWPRWTDNRAIYLYQRTNASAPRFCQNTGFEAGVYLKFIVDFYDDLPDRTVFTHSDPGAHNPDFERWIDCLSPNLTYTSINPLFVERRSIRLWENEPGYPHQVPRVEQCWRNLARAFGKNLTSTNPPEEPVVSFYCCNQIAMSREHIRRHPVEHYRAAYRLVGLNEKCSGGWFDGRENWAMSNLCYRETPPGWFAEGRESKSAQAGGMEHLTHFLLNDEPLISAPYTDEQYCRNFLPSAQCPGSPCTGTPRP